MAAQNTARPCMMALAIAFIAGACANGSQQTATAARTRALEIRPTMPTPSRPAAVPHSVWITTRSGVTAIDATTGRSRFTAAGALPAPDWSVLVASRPDRGDTRLVSLEPTTGAERTTQTVRGRWAVRAVSGSGAWVALAGTTTARIGAVPAGRSSTDIAVAALAVPSAPRVFHLAGNFLPEAFTTNGHGLFLIEYLPSAHPDHYQVRRLALDTGTIDEVITRDKQPAEEMRGQSRTQVYAPNRATLYTLYTEAAKDRGHAFIHTLSLEGDWVHCLDLPAELGFHATASAPEGAVNVSPDGATLYVAGPAGKLAIIDTNTLLVREIRSLASSPTTSTTASPLIAVSAGHAWVTNGDRAVRIDSVTGMPPPRSLSLPPAATSLTETSDGRYLVVTAPGRLLVLDTTTGSVITDHTANGLTEPVDRVHAV